MTLIAWHGDRWCDVACGGVSYSLVASLVASVVTGYLAVMWTYYDLEVPCAVSGAFKVDSATAVSADGSGHRNSWTCAGYSLHSCVPSCDELNDRFTVIRVLSIIAVVTVVPGIGMRLGSMGTVGHM